jgi:hypothetical protein
VIFDAAFKDPGHVAMGHSGQQGAVHDSSPLSPLQRLRRNGFRIVEQRFPRAAWVVVGYPN